MSRTVLELPRALWSSVRRHALPAGLLGSLALAPIAEAQARRVAPEVSSAWSAQHQLVVPNARRAAFATELPVEITGVQVHVRVVGNAARTTLEVDLHNPGGRQAEAELLLPVPSGAAIGGFFFEGTAEGATAQLLPADEARATYDAIVARLKDPARLEFAGMSAVRASVFPVPPNGTQSVRLIYDELLADVAGRIDYELPRTASLAADVPWTFGVEVVAPTGVATVYSPSHRLHEVSRTGTSASLKVEGAAANEPGPFRFSIVTGRDALSGSILAWPEADGDGGAFLLVAGLGADAADAPAIPREVTLVLDRSGSMAGAKFDQAREAARQVIEGLKPGERFRIVDYSDTVSAFSVEPVEKTPISLEAARAYLASLSTGGGTNIGDALAEALKPAPAYGNLGLVLFLTDGLATVGETSERGLREILVRSNAFEHRVFPFGVGDDVNVPLLDSVATTTRGSTTYVRPGQDVEVAVGDVFRRLKGPRLADLELEVFDADGNPDLRTVRDLLPLDLPDLYEGDQLVLLGRYERAVPIAVHVKGRAAEGARTFRIRTDLGSANAKNDFVPRLWAARKIAVLMDEIRQSVGDGAALAAASEDPRTKELADEILRLSTEYGVLSEYTAFLALEGTDLGNWNDLAAVTCRNLVDFNGNNRWGAAAVNNALNFDNQARANQVNARQTYLDASGNSVAIGGNRQVAGGLALQRGAQWIEGELLQETDGEELPEADEAIVLGTEAHQRLIDELVADGRNGLAALPGEVLFRHRGRVLRLVQDVILPEEAAPAEAAPEETTDDTAAGATGEETANTRGADPRGSRNGHQW